MAKRSHRGRDKLRQKGSKHYHESIAEASAGVKDITDTKGKEAQRYWHPEEDTTGIKHADFLAEDFGGKKGRPPDPPHRRGRQAGPRGGTGRGPPRHAQRHAGRGPPQPQGAPRRPGPPRQDRRPASEAPTTEPTLEQKMRLLEQRYRNGEIDRAAFVKLRRKYMGIGGEGADGKGATKVRVLPRASDAAAAAVPKEQPPPVVFSPPEPGEWPPTAAEASAPKEAGPEGKGREELPLEERLSLLEDRLLRGDISEETFRMLRAKYIAQAGYDPDAYLIAREKEAAGAPPAPTPTAAPPTPAEPVIADVAGPQEGSDELDDWDEDDAGLLLARAKEAFANRRHQDALEAAETVLDLDPESKDAWYIKGQSLRLLGRYEEAAEALGKAGLDYIYKG